MHLFLLRTAILFLFLLSFSGCQPTDAQEEQNDLALFEEEDLAFVDETTNRTLIQLTREGLREERLLLDSINQIVQQEGPAVVPTLYNRYLSVQYLPPEQRREAFIQQVLPHILIAKYGIDREKRMLEEIRQIADGASDEAEAARVFIRKQILKYEANNYQDLLEKLTTHPVSIVLAQAIVETDWGSARFFEEGNNLFGFQSTDETSPKVESPGAAPGEVVYFRKYIKFLPESVIDYFKMIGTGDRFVVFRNQRAKTNDPHELVTYLDEYHPDIGSAYPEKLALTIEKYDLTQYDDFFIDTNYVDRLSEAEVTDLVDEAVARKKKIVDTNAKRLRAIAQETLRIQYKTIEDVEDIIPIKGERVVPYVYQNVVTLKYLPVKEKKKKFLDIMIPAILVTNHSIRQARIKLDNIHEKWSDGIATSPADSAFVAKLLKDWRADDIPHLQDKMVTRPMSVVLAQAALETGWGSSRFFIKANNVFGVWSFDPNESRIAASEARENMQVYVKRYPNISASIYDYFKTIARGPYQQYRDKRIETDDPYVLVNYLLRYSEMGQHYINSLKIVMRKADLPQYDSYRLDAAYIEDTYVPLDSSYTALK